MQRHPCHLQMMGLFCKRAHKRDNILQKRPIIVNLATAPLSPAETADEFSMGWLRLVGSIKLYVTFTNEPYKRDNILQKKPLILSILLTVATSYMCIHP